MFLFFFKRVHPVGLSVLKDKAASRQQTQSVDVLAEGF